MAKFGTSSKIRASKSSFDGVAKSEPPSIPESKNSRERHFEEEVRNTFFEDRSLFLTVCIVKIDCNEPEGRKSLSLLLPETDARPFEYETEREGDGFFWENFRMRNDMKWPCASSLDESFPKILLKPC